MTMQFDFLVCSERSGSNLITRIMNAHPEVCGPFPTHVIRTFSEALYRYSDLSIDAHWRALLEDVAALQGGSFAEWASGVTAAFLEENVSSRDLGSVVRCVFEVEAGKQGKRRLFVKENHVCGFADFLLTHFPEACFLQLVRDPRDMALTWKRLGRGGVVAAARTWRDDQDAAIALAERITGRLHVTSFEDLVRDPETVLRKICEFLGLAYSERMLLFYEDPFTQRNADRIVSWQDLRKRIQPDQAGIYRDGLAEVEVRYVEAVCAREMSQFGYTPDFPPDRDLEELTVAVAEIAGPDRSLTREEQEAFARNARAAARILKRDVDEQS